MPFDTHLNEDLDALRDLVRRMSDAELAPQAARIDASNEFPAAMWRRLGEVLRELSADEALRAVVIRGAGDKSFAPGNDIGEFEHERANVEQARAYGQVMARTIAAIGDCRQ